MPYSLEVAEDLDKAFVKLERRDKITFLALNKKIQEVLENPLHFKPLRVPRQNLRRVHISGCFVLIYCVDENRKTVRLVEFEHHDNAY